MRSNAFSVSVDRELDDTNREMGEILQNTEPLRDLVGEDTGEVDDTAKRLMDMPPAERSNIFQRFQADIQRYRGYCKTLANAPESTWYAALPALDQFPMSEPNRDVRALLGLTLPVVTQVFQSTLKTRTQLRLLRVHALVESYRWKTGRLPLKLTELESPIAVTDPLVSAPFKYFVKGDEYELYSDGVPPVGRIDLVYSRPKVQGGDSSDPVNP